MKKIILLMLCILSVQVFSKENITSKRTFTIPNKIPDFCNREFIENDIIVILKNKDLKKLATVIPKEMAFSFSGHDNVYTFKNIEKELAGHEFTKLLFDQDYLSKRWSYVKKRKMGTPLTFQFIMTEVFLQNKGKVFGWDNEQLYYDKEKKKEYHNITIGIIYKEYRYILDIFCKEKDYIIYRFGIDFS